MEEVSFAAIINENYLNFPNFQSSPKPPYADSTSTLYALPSWSDLDPPFWNQLLVKPNANDIDKLNKEMETNADNETSYDVSINPVIFKHPNINISSLFIMGYNGTSCDGSLCSVQETIIIIIINYRIHYYQIYVYYTQYLLQHPEPNNTSKLNIAHHRTTSNLNSGPSRSLL